MKPINNISAHESNGNVLMAVDYILSKVPGLREKPVFRNAFMLGIMISFRSRFS
jgi:hypothetical protein